MVLSNLTFHFPISGPPLVPLEFKVLNTTQTNIVLSWKPNFPGGDFTQVFLLEHRVLGGEWKTKQYEDNPSGSIVANVVGLEAGTVYEFRVRARNSRDANNEGEYTEILQLTTEGMRFKRN